MKHFASAVAIMFLLAMGAWAEGVTRLAPIKPVANTEGMIPLDGHPKSFVGTMKIPVILVDFKDVKFAEEHGLHYYEDLFNRENYADTLFFGSVHDYFLAQSNGKLNVSFDIFGVFTVDTNQKACYDRSVLVRSCRNKMLSIIDEHLNEVDFSSYDWNEDGFVDAIGIIAAGKGWGETYSFDQILVKGDVYISEYFLVNESNSLATSSFGIICHEFSHCLGLPDLYTKSGYGVLESYDLMDFGQYGGNGYVPVGYSAYEKWLCGWQTPIEITKDTVITALKPQSENGDAFWIINPNNPDEAFFVENRQNTGWDTFIPESGLMITHLNYNLETWVKAYPSTDYLKTKIGVYYVMANGTNDALQPGVLYPYNGNDSLTAYSLPDWQWVVGYGAGRNFVNGAIVDIRQNEDGTISFKFKAVDNSNLKLDEFEVAVDGLWYHCNRKTMIAEVIKSKGEAYSGKVTIPSRLSFDDEVFVVSSISDSAFFESNVTDVVISEGVSKIGQAAFMFSMQLVSVEIPLSVAVIDTFAFFLASSLTKVFFSEGVKAIEVFAFAGTNIENLALPLTLVSVGVSSFAEVPATSIEIPASVEKIERNAFAFENLDTVIVKNSTPIALKMEDYYGMKYTPFGSSDMLPQMILRVPKGSLEAYKKADVWKLFGTIEEYETDSTKVPSTVIARRAPRYDLKMGERWFDLRGRQFKGRPKHKGFYVER